MDETQYYADAPPTTVALAIKTHFEALTDQQKLYAHHISRSVAFVMFRTSVHEDCHESVFHGLALLSTQPETSRTVFVIKRSRASLCQAVGYGRKVALTLCLHQLPNVLLTLMVIQNREWY